MNKNRKIYRSVIILAFCFMAMMIPAASLKAAVKISHTSYALVAGKSKKLKIKGTKSAVSWSSANTKIATVSQKGVVKAKKAGSVYVYAKVDGKTYKCKMKIVSLSSTKVVLPKVGSKKTLKANNGKNTKWKSSNKRIVKVSSKGVLEAKNPGMATITCTTRGRSIKCKVYVPTLNASSVKLSLNNKFTLRVAYGPSKPTFSSSNPSVVTVDSKSGLCKGIKYGTSVVTAKLGSITYKCDVAVAENGDVTTPKSWIAYDTRHTTYEQKVNIGGGKTRTYTVFGQGYDGNRFKSNIELYVDEATKKVVPAPKPVEPTTESKPTTTATTDTTVNTSTQESAETTTPVVKPPKKHTYKVKSYLGDHGCAACSTTTILSGYAGYKEKPRVMIKDVELKTFGYSAWNANYSHSRSYQMPISLYGITKVLDSYNIANKYVRTFPSYNAAIDQIRKHLLTGKPVVICVGQDNGILGGSSSRWTGGRHTMVLLGMTDEYKVMVADPADRGNSGFGRMGRIKQVELSDVCSYIWSTPKPGSSKASKPYYEGYSYNGGYILVGVK